MARFSDNDVKKYTASEEVVSSILHIVGTGLSIAGLVLLAVFGSVRGDVWHVVSFVIYGSTLIVMYLSSTLYHSVPYLPLKRFFQILDHSAIYLLIAGTYSPFLLVNLRGPWGWSLFGVIWGIAAAGVLYESMPTAKHPRLSVALYVALGWLCLLAAKQIISKVRVEALILLAAGGLLYTVGVVFYAWKKLPYGHCIWHGFVLVGSICHYFAVFYCL